MIGRTNVGGGAGLNFKVVGGTSAPASPKENTIWVNTDDEITGWVFSTKRPIDIVDSYLATTYVNSYGAALLVEADFKPDTTYTMTFEGVAGQKFYVNENFAGYKVTTVTSGRNTVAFTTKSELSTENSNQYTTGKGWVVLKNNANLESAPVFNKLRIVEGDKDIDPSGMVWISTGTSSAVAFNALKKNGIQVYPLSAKQYIGGAWVDVTAKSYQNGAWADWWNGELYSYGNEFEFITGGWIPYQMTFAEDVTATDPTITRSDDGLTIGISQSGAYGGTFVTANKIPFDGKKTLAFTGSAVGDNTTRCIVGVWSTLQRNFDTNRVAIYQFGSSFSGTATIDISSLDGEYYVGIHVYGRDKSVTMQELKLV